MKYMLLMNYAGGAGCDVPMHEWEPHAISAHIGFMRDLATELTQSGELVLAEGLSEQARTVTSDGREAPVVTDGPFAESKELLAGFWIVDVDDDDRALEIAARASTAPGPGGVPIQIPIQVRAVMSAPIAEV